MWNLGPDGRKALGEKAKAYADSEFGYQNTVDMWHDSMIETINNWKKNYNRFTVEEL